MTENTDHRGSLSCCDCIAMVTASCADRRAVRATCERNQNAARGAARDSAPRRYRWAGCQQSDRSRCRTRARRCWSCPASPARADRWHSRRRSCAPLRHVAPQPDHRMHRDITRACDLDHGFEILAPILEQIAPIGQRQLRGNRRHMQRHHFARCTTRRGSPRSGPGFRACSSVATGIRHRERCAIPTPLRAGYPMVFREPRCVEK